MARAARRGGEFFASDKTDANIRMNTNHTNNTNLCFRDN